MTQRETGSSGRRHYIDRLRVTATFAVFCYHVARVFDADWWHVKDSSSALLFTVTRVFLDMWNMPLFMMLAGMAAFFALRSRSPGAFLWERVQRLVVPFVMGMVVLIPPQDYYEYVSRLYVHTYTFWTAWGKFYQAPRAPRNLLWIMSASNHLWFLAFLCIYSVIALPLFQWLGSTAGKRALSTVARLAQRPAGIMVFALPLLVNELLLRDRYPRYGDWANFCHWLLPFLYGYVLAADDQLMAAVRKNRHIVWLAAVVLTPIVVAWEARYFNLIQNIAAVGYPPHLAFKVLFSLDVWALLLVALDIGMQRLDYDSPFLRYWSEAAFPFYLLHQTVIVIIAYYVTRQVLALPLKAAIVFVSSFLASLGVYELLIRRIGVTRWLFGLRPARHARLRPIPARPGS